jgi:hypothetical protein
MQFKDIKSGGINVWKPSLCKKDVAGYKEEEGGYNYNLF